VSGRIDAGGRGQRRRRGFQAGAVAGFGRGARETAPANRHPRPSQFPCLRRRPRPSRLRGSLAVMLLLAGCSEPPKEEPIEPPQVLTDSVPFLYPIELWDHNISGQTVLLLRVDPMGQVDSVMIDAGSGYPEFDSAAVQGAQKLRFIAARQGERRIPMWTKVPVRFSRDTANKMGIGQ
jgi:TonB family protein